VCQDCSVGCNVDVFSQQNQIYRINPRENHDVNGYFMCDIGRYGFHRFEEIKRVTQPLIRKGDSFVSGQWKEAIQETADRLNRAGEKLAGVTSPYHTNETNFMLGLMVDGILGNLSQIHGEEINYPSGFRISRDRSPNRHGMNDVCPVNVEDLISEIDEQNIRTIYILDDGIDRDFDEVWKSILSKMDFVVVQTYRMTMLAESANIILPGLAPFEREGTITNDGGRIQWLRPSLPIKGESRADWEILMKLTKTMDKEVQVFTDISQVMKKMGEKIPAYKDVSFFKLGDKGLPLNGIGPK
jgi:NADH-quinone oxidoreductase subunit G